MDSLKDLAARYKLPEEPEEVRKLKAYLFERYGLQTTVHVSAHLLVLDVPGAALAAQLQLEREQLMAECRLTRKLRFRIV